VSLNVCGHCSTRFSIGAEHCPQCGNADYYLEGSMAKVTRHGGASYEGVSREVEAPVEVELEVADVADEAVDVQEPFEYAAWLITDLRDELGERGLTKSGNKDELVARLVADDEATAEAEPEATEEVE
jgi:hypothetical protein